MIKKQMLWSNAAVLISIVALTGVTNINGLVGQIYQIDHFFHFDYFIMSAGWAHLKGLAIFKDVHSNYSVGMTLVLSHLAKLFGGFDYPSMVKAVMFLGIGYWCVSFLYLRAWLGSLFFAAFGIFLAIGLHMFHDGVSPVIWRFPSATVVRHIFDLGVFFVLLQHSINAQRRWLWTASGICALAVAYMLDTGVYLTLSFYVYILAHLAVKHFRLLVVTSAKDLLILAGIMLLPFIGAGLILFAIQGPAMLTAGYWHNATEYSRLFLNGFGDLPLTYAIDQKQYFNFFVGMLIPVFYVASLIFAGTLIVFNYFKREHCLVLFLSCYGLGLYHYYIYRSGPTSYDAVIVPCVLLLCFWLKMLQGSWPAPWRFYLKLVLAAWLVLWYCSNPWVKQYPNIFHGPFQSKAMDELDLSLDIALIDRLTLSDQAVALVSSFETKILIDANRKPFFYYFPFIYSLPFDSRDFHGTELLTVDRLQKTIHQLQEKRPEYVFVQRSLFEHKLHPLYYLKYTALTYLLSYLNDAYQPYAYGKYLCALRLK